MHNILTTIGNTPLVKLDRIAKDDGTILVKLEYFSPGHYDETEVNSSKGERWFCSENDACNAGRRKSKV